MRPRPVRVRCGFTLIEILAVVIIIALTLSIVLPNLAATSASQLRVQARAVVSYLEYARQRAIVTGVPHRVLIDVEAGFYGVDWFVTEQRAAGVPQGDESAEPVAPNAPPDYSGNTPIPMSPPTDELRDYYPIPSRFGADARLGESFHFEGVGTPEGWIDRGEVQVVFERDGTSDFAEIVIADDEGHVVRLEVQPLFDRVRIREDAD